MNIKNRSPKHHTATISLNGIEILSYRGDAGRVLSPGTIPGPVAEQMAEALALDGKGASIAWDLTEVVRIGEKHFENVALVEVSRTWPAGEARRVMVRWVGTIDYSVIEINVSDAIMAQGQESARALLSQGWEGGGASYDLGAYPGDEEAVTARIGRALTRHERLMLEASVRTNLDLDD